MKEREASEWGKWAEDNDIPLVKVEALIQRQIWILIRFSRTTL